MVVDDDEAAGAQHLQPPSTAKKKPNPVIGLQKVAGRYLTWWGYLKTGRAAGTERFPGKMLCRTRLLPAKFLRWQKKKSSGGAIAIRCRGAPFISKSRFCKDFLPTSPLLRVDYPDKYWVNWHHGRSYPRFQTRKAQSARRQRLRVRRWRGTCGCDWLQGERRICPPI